MTHSPTSVGSYFSLWIDLPGGVSSAKSGYQMRIEDVATNRPNPVVHLPVQQLDPRRVLRIDHAGTLPTLVPALTAGVAAPLIPAAG